MALLKQPDHSSSLPLCSSMLRFLAERTCLETFVIHDWLSTIGDRELHQIEQGAFGIVSPDQQRTGSAQEKDIAGMVTIAVGAEAGRFISREVVIKNLNLFISRLMLTACAERLRRTGSLHIAERLSLSSDRPPAVMVTATGLLETAQSEDRIVNSLLKMSSALQ